MQVVMMDSSRIDRLWPVIEQVLEPALRQSPDYDVMALYDRLICGSALLFEVDEGAQGLWVVSLNEDDGLVAWTTAIAGKIDGGPKARLSLIREAVEAIETVATMAGCKAHRICGRDWNRILPDYTPFEGERNGIEKRLAA